METIEHRTVVVNGITMHVAEKGEGPLVLLIHGFPELWYTWRHQILALASLGYRAVAPDLRGFGDSDAPPSPSSYTSLSIVGDLIALLDALAGPEERAFVVGHDWGAFVAWYLCLYRPDRIKALVNMSVAFTPRNPSRKPTDTFRAVYLLLWINSALQWLKGKIWIFSSLSDHHNSSISSEAGEMEAEFAMLGARRVLEEFLTYRTPEPLLLPRGTLFGHPQDTPIELPAWLTKEDVDYYTSKYEKTGFTGGFNYYRAFDLNWELTAPWTGAQVKVPSKFIVGDLDLTYNTFGTKDYLEKGGMKKVVPLLEEVVVLQGVAHFLHEERPDEINAHIHNFFQKF